MAGKYGSDKFAVLLVDGYDMLADAVQDASARVRSIFTPAHGCRDTWVKFLPVNMREATLAQNGAFFNDTTAGVHAGFKAAGQVARVVCWAFGGDVVAGAFWGAAGTYQTDYAVIAKVADLTRANPSYQISGVVDVDGEILQPTAAKSADWNTKALGTRVDSGAATTNGAAGYLQVLAFSGFTGFVGKIQHSSDDTTYTDLVTFTNVTSGPTAQCVEVSGTVNRYLSFNGDVTGTGSITTFSGLARR